MFIYTIEGMELQPTQPQKDNRFDEIMANFNRMKEENPNFGLLERLLAAAEEKENKEEDE